MNGWVKLHRKVRDWEWYDDANTFRVFFHCLVSANWRPRVWRGLEIEVGSFFSSYEKIGEDLKLSKQQVRTSINKLKSTSEVTSKATHNGLLITVTKYASYNDPEKDEQHSTTHTSNTSLTPFQHSGNTLVTPTEEGEEIEEGKEGKKPPSPAPRRLDGFDEFWKAYPQKVGKGDAERAWLKHRPPLPEILAALEWQRKQQKWTDERGRFIPNPATYLNQKRWLDEPAAPRPRDPQLAF